MADDKLDAVDTLDDEPRGKALETASPSDELDTDDGEKLVFGKYKSISEAEKSYKELESKLGKQGSELGSLRERLMAQEKQDKIADALSLLAKAKEPVKESEIPDLEKYLEQVGEEMAEDPKKGVKKLAELMSGWTGQEGKRVESAAELKIKALEERLSQMGEQYERLDPSYTENKQIIDSLVSKGISLKDAKIFAKEVRSMVSGDESRISPPSGIGGNGRVVAASKADSPILTKDEIAMLRKEGFSDEEIKDTIAEERARRSRS